MKLCQCVNTRTYDWYQGGICTSCGGVEEMNKYLEFANLSKESADKWVNDTVQRLEARIRELEHQHKNDEAANQLLNEVCESQRKRIKELEKCKQSESPSYPYC